MGGRWGALGRPQSGRAGQARGARLPGTLAAPGALRAAIRASAVAQCRPPALRWRAGRRNGGAEPPEWARLNTEKQRPARAGDPAPGARSAGRGSLAAGRAADAQGWSARRRSEATVQALGHPTVLDLARAAEAAGDPRASDRLRRWLDMDPRALARLVAPDRQLRLGLCGVAFVTRRDGAVGFLRRGCKDRVCPVCSARRSRMVAARLTQHITGLLRRYRLRSRRSERVEPVWAFTFTRRKVLGESPRQAIDATLNGWRAFTERHGRGLTVGGMRSLEVTARRAGDIVRRADGTMHRVEAGGTHAHLHVLVELAPGVTPTQVVAAWCAGSDAETWCQRPRQVHADGAAVYQACKYPVDMSGLLEVLTAAPDYVRGVVDALHGRRVLAVYGTWRGVKVAGEEPGDGRVVFGDRSLTTLATTDPHTAPDVAWTDGSTSTALDVLRAIIEAGSLPAQRHASGGVGVARRRETCPQGGCAGDVVGVGAARSWVAAQARASDPQAGQDLGQLALIGEAVE